jgi:hypothetical protein
MRLWAAAQKISGMAQRKTDTMDYEPLPRMRIIHFRKIRSNRECIMGLIKTGLKDTWDGLREPNGAGFVKYLGGIAEIATGITLEAVGLGVKAVKAGVKASKKAEAKKKRG